MSIAIHFLHEAIRLDSATSEPSPPVPSASDVIRAERRRLLEFIRSRVRVPEDAEDIAQDVFYQLAASDIVVEPIEKITSWLFTVARNKIIDLYRKRKPEAMSNLESEEDDAPRFVDTLLADPAEAPEERYFRALLWEELAEALEELPPHQRQVFVMHELEGLSFKEIAEETGTGVPTLLSRKRYAVAHLRERLRELYEEWEE